jgi:hypothetical protein
MTALGDIRDRPAAVEMLDDEVLLKEEMRVSVCEHRVGRISSPERIYSTITAKYFIDKDGGEQTLSKRLRFNRRASSAVTVPCATATSAMYGGALARVSFRRTASTAAALRSMAIFDKTKTMVKRRSGAKRKPRRRRGSATFQTVPADALEERRGGGRRRTLRTLSARGSSWSPFAVVQRMYSGACITSVAMFCATLSNIANSSGTETTNEVYRRWTAVRVKFASELYRVPMKTKTKTKKFLIERKLVHYVIPHPSIFITSIERFIFSCFQYSTDRNRLVLKCDRR